MASIHDLKTVSKAIDDLVAIAANSFGIGLVPDGKTRFITYLSISNVDVAATGILIVTEADAEDVAGDRIDLHQVAPEEATIYPDAPSMDNPILSIPSGKAITMFGSAAGLFEVTFQYFDA